MEVVGLKNMEMKIEETELRLGLPGGARSVDSAGGDVAAAAAAKKRGFSETADVDLKLNLSSSKDSTEGDREKAKSQNKEKSATLLADPAKPPAKAQVVGWPPVRSYRKNMFTAAQKSKTTTDHQENENKAATFVKVSMDGAPYLRKVDLKMYKSYRELSDALGKMFSSFTIGTCEAQGMKDFMNESKLMDLLNGSDYVPTYEDKDGDWMLVGDVPWEMFVESCKRLRIMKGTEAIGLAPRAMEKCKNRS